jgi:hypothetical protein
VANHRAAKPLASKAVFVNCPFDVEFKQIFRSMIFAVIPSGYNPRCALDSTDGAEIIVSKIATMLGECDYGIHDLSRVEVASTDPGDATASLRRRPLGYQRPGHRSSRQRSWASNPLRAELAIGASRA